MLKILALTLGALFFLTACPTPKQQGGQAVRTPPTASNKSKVPSKPDPLLSSAYVRYPFDEFAVAYDNVEDAWWNLGTEGTGEGVSMKDALSGMKRWKKGLVKEYILPQHTLVEVLSEKERGQESIIKIKLIGKNTVTVSVTKDAPNGKLNVVKKEVSTEGLVLYAFSDDIVRKGTYKTSLERETAEAAENIAVAKLRVQAERGPYPVDRVRFKRK